LLQERSAGIVIFRREGDDEYFLLLRYGYDRRGFAKGNIEQGETEREAAIREAREETGLTNLTFVDDFRTEIEYYYRKMGETVHKKVVYFLAETPEKDVKISSEHVDYEWLPLDDALRLMSFRNDKKVLIRAWEAIKNQTKSVGK